MIKAIVKDDQGDPVHRRDPHHRRRRRDRGRLDGRVEPAQAARWPSGELRCIGSTTFQEYKAAFERDRALARRFQKIEVLEPTRRRDHRDPEGPQERSTRSTTTSTTPTRRCEAAAKLAAKYINDRHLPDKAIDVIDEAGAADRLRPTAAQADARRRARSRRSSRRWPRSRGRSVSASDEAALRELEPRAQEGHLRTGPRPSTRWSRRSSCRARASAAADKPIGSFLFSGPTGVGKTELAKQLARGPGRRVPALRHDRVHGEAHRVAAHRRAAGLRRLRSGRACSPTPSARRPTRCWCSTRSRRRTRTSSTSCCR